LFTTLSIASAHICAYFTYFFFFSKHTATTEIYTLSLHDALPILRRQHRGQGHGVIPELVGNPFRGVRARLAPVRKLRGPLVELRSEEHTSELQSRGHLVCRLLLEKKNKLAATN